MPKLAAAGAPAAAGLRVGGGLVLHLEGVAAPARRDRLRVVDLEAGLGEPVEPVDGRAGEVRRAERVEDDPDAVQLELVVAFEGAAVEPESVLEARAAAALNGDAE